MSACRNARRLAVASGVALALLALASCEPLGRLDPGAVEVAAERLVERDAIPAHYGRLVGVTTTAGYRENFAQLWFEEEDTGTVRVVYFHFRDRVLDPRVELIPRRPAAPAATPPAADPGEER